MAKKARATTAKKAPVLTAKKVRAAKAGGVGKLKAQPKKPAAVKRETKIVQPDPEVEAARARKRALWKTQEREATSIELAKHGTLVDERARARATTGMSWSNRKPR